MTVSVDDGAAPHRIRAVADEYTVGDSTVLEISDPLNANAWIHVMEPVAVER